MRQGNVAILAPLGAAAHQDGQGLAILTKVDPVAWPEIDPVLEHASADTLDVREVPQFQSVNRRGQLAAAPASSFRNHSPTGLDPLRSRYSRTVNV